MAPTKRARRHEDDAEVITTESATSSLRQDMQRKKARVSTASASKPRSTREQSASSEASDDSDSEDLPDADDAGSKNLPPATQYEILRDGNFEHLKNQEADDLRATQIFLSRKQRIGENHAANNAIIEEITCINFMCHEKLHVALGPLINFVVGHNGSGKSAVLTAITLCLGGKAAATNRGASLKSLIKEGKDQGLLIIKLKNQGLDAYQPDTYGESIIIERSFSRSGSSGFKTKSATGKIISTKKSEVDDIVEYFQLQVDNPMNVLTQDAAKSFISLSTPAQKYKFFKEGVQLQALDQDYKIVSDICDSIASKLVDSKDNLQELEKIAEKANEKFQELQQQAGINARAKEVMAKLAWKQIEIQEEGVAIAENDIATAQARIDIAEQDKIQKDSAFQQIEQKLERHKASQAELLEESNAATITLEKAKEEFDDANRKIKDDQNKLRMIGKQVTDAKQKVAQCEVDIEQEKRRMEDADGGANAQKRSELEAAQRAAADAKQAIETHQAGLPRLEEQAQAARQTIERFDGQVNRKRAEVEASRKKLEGLNANRGDSMAGFPPNMAKVLQNIQRDSRYHQKPVGPLGMHIKLLKPDWSSILERSLGNLLQGFIVTSKQDQVILSKTLREHRMEYCPVLIGNNSPINTDGYEPDEQYDTILRILEIDNDLVKRQLIIAQGIEQSILIKDRQQAMRVMFEGSRPRNVKQAFCVNGAKRDFGFRLGFSGHGFHDMGPVKPPEWRPRMKTAIESRISYERDTLRQLESELHGLDREQKQLRGNKQRCDAAIIQYKRDQGRLKLASQKADQKVDDLTNELDSLQIEDGRLEVLKTELAEAQEELRIVGDAYGDASLENQPLITVKEEKRGVFEAAKLASDDVQSRQSKINNKIRNATEARSHALRDTNTASDKIEEAKAAKAAAEAKREERAARLIEFTGEALKVSPRVSIPAEETEEILSTRLTQLREQKRRARAKMGMTEEECQRQYEEAKTASEDAKTNQDDLEDLLIILKQSFKKRMEMYRRFQRFISARSRINFSYMLSERAFRGKLTIDHKAKKLDVHVEPDITTKSGKGRQTKTLSGGEKSFSSICLLLSLWEAMGAPLRCLDEFDVFMDEVNRDVSTKMLISAARKSVGRQFILITPKALGAGIHEHAKDVKIIKLFDPRKKQARIDDMMDVDEE